MTTSPKPDELHPEGTGGTEMFYVDALGNKRDEDLHTEMLDNPDADAKWREKSKQNAIDGGMSQDDADLMYG